MLAGNVVTDSMTEQLILNGADIVKVTALAFIRVCESGMWVRLVSDLAVCAPPGDIKLID